MGATAILDPPSLRVDCGATAELTVSARNTGTLVDEVRLEVLGEAAAWAVIEPSLIRLYPDSDGSAVVRFSPPKDARTPYGRIPFGLRVLSREDPDHGTVEEGEIEVTPFVELSADILPKRSRGWMSASHRIALDNRGNAGVTLSFSGSDPDAALDVAVTPSSILAAPGTATIGRAKVTAQRRLWRGTPQTFPFIVTMLPDAGTLPPGLETPPPALTLDGTFQQHPVVPPTLPRTMATIIALLLASVVAWVFVVREQVQKTANAAVQEPLDRNEKDIRSVAEKVGVQLPSDKGSATPEPSASASPTAPADAGVLGAPVTVALRIEAAPQDTKTTDVPLAADQALTVTAFSVQNPFHDIGLLTIGRRGVDGQTRAQDTLLTAALEDIQTQTTSFNPAVVLLPGETIAAKVECTAPGQRLTGQVDGEGEPRTVAGANCETFIVVTGYTRVTPNVPVTQQPTSSPSPTETPSPTG